MKEKREYRRWPCWMPCRCTIRKKAFNGFIIELSKNGSRVILPIARNGSLRPTEFPADGTPVGITLRPDRENITLRGKVVHRNGRQKSNGHAMIGLEFTGSSRQRGRKLEAFLPGPRAEKFHRETVPEFTAD